MVETLKTGQIRNDSEDHRVRTGAARREATRRKLLSSAVWVFAEKGADVPQIEDFIAAAGVARGTFYNYFKTPAELLEAVTAELGDEVMRAIEKHVREVQDPVMRMILGCSLYMKIAVDHPAWGAFTIRTGIRRGALGKLVDEYLPRDLQLALDSGAAHFPSVRAARDILLGSMRYSIASVIAGDVSQGHLHDVMQMSLAALGMDQEMSHKLAFMDVPELELPAVFETLKTV